MRAWWRGGIQHWHIPWKVADGGKRETCSIDEQGIYPGSSGRAGGGSGRFEFALCVLRMLLLRFLFWGKNCGIWGGDIQVNFLEGVGEWAFFFIQIAFFVKVSCLLHFIPLIMCYYLYVEFGCAWRCEKRARATVTGDLSGDSLSKSFAHLETSLKSAHKNQDQTPFSIIGNNRRFRGHHCCQLLQGGDPGTWLLSPTSFSVFYHVESTPPSSPPLPIPFSPKPKAIFTLTC